LRRRGIRWTDCAKPVREVLSGALWGGANAAILE